MATAISKDVAAWTKDWRRLQNQKHRFRGGVEARVIFALGMYYGEQFLTQARDTILTRPLNDDDKNKLFLIFNLMKRASRRKIGRLWAASGVNSFYASPDVNTPTAMDKATVVNSLIKGLNKKLRERRQHWTRLWWTVNAGVCLEHTPWVEDAVEEAIPQMDEAGQLLWRDHLNPDQNAVIPQSVVERFVESGQAPPERFSVVEQIQVVGDVGSEIISPLNFFIDSSVTSIDKLGPDQACYILQVKTVDWAKEVFGNDVEDDIPTGSGKDLGIVRTRLLDRGPSYAGLNLSDLMPAVQGSQGKDDPRMFLLATRYQPSCKDYPHGRRSLFVPGGGQPFDDGETDYGEIPLTDFHFGPPATSFWSEDFMTDLVPAQKFLNKRMSQLGEMANAQIYETLLVGDDLSRRDIPSDMPGVVEGGLDESGNPKVVALQHASPPTFFIESIRLVIELFQLMSASDLTDHPNYPGQFRGPMALPLLQEIIDSEDGPLYEHFAEQLATMHGQRVNRVKEFYPPVRTMHYTGERKKDEVLVFHTQDILRSGIDFTISVDPKSLMPEFSAMRESRLVERMQSPLAGLYVNRRTGRMDFSKVALELKFDLGEDVDRATQYRELAKHLIKKLWDAVPLPPDIPFPFWDHETILDELEAAMGTTEFTFDASPQVKQGFQQIYEKSRQYLAAIQDAQMKAVQGQMQQGLMAQVSQQVAAKVAADTVDQAMGQIQAQAAQAKAMPPVQALAQAMAANRQAQGPQQNRLAQGQPVRRGLPPTPARQ